MRRFLAALLLCVFAFPTMAKSHHHAARHHRAHHRIVDRLPPVVVVAPTLDGFFDRQQFVSLPPAERYRITGGRKVWQPFGHQISGGGSLVAEAERHLGATGSIVGMARAWCGAYARLVMRGATGRDPGARFNVARNWAGIGSASAPRLDAIGVMRHHVGFVKEVRGDRVLLVSGNHGHRVAAGWYPIGRFIAFRSIA